MTVELVNNIEVYAMHSTHRVCTRASVDPKSLAITVVALTHNADTTRIANKSI